MYINNLFGFAQYNVFLSAATQFNYSFSSSLNMVGSIRIPVYIRSYSIDNNISPQSIFIAPRRARIPIKSGIEKKNCVEVNIILAEEIRRRPMTIIR